jgi:ubiquinone/menaquinone biosynthesis C-methylase UbiE
VLVKGVLAVLALAYSALSAGGSDARPGPVEVMKERVLAHVAPRPGMVVAEIGVGGGWFVVRVAEAVGPNGVVYGTDINAEAIAAVQGKLPHLAKGAGRVDLRLCRDDRDTALDDLPDNHVDTILMVDSLCFEAHEARERDVAYLRRFLRILRPGGRLVHHMDCLCDVSPEAVVAQFTDAGFSPRVESIDVSPDPAVVDPNWPCRTEAQRKRHAFVGVFRKPGG